MSSIISEDVGRVRGFQIVVLIFALLNLLIRGTELLLDVISTFVMITPLFYGNTVAFQKYLTAEGNRVLWKGPYPEMEVEQNVTEEVAVSGDDIVELKTNVHLWGCYFLMQVIIFVFAWVLVFSTKQKNFSGNVAWLSFSAPVFLGKLLQMIFDLSFSDFQQRFLQDQLLQGFDVTFQLVGVILVICFLRQLYLKNEEMKQIDRYNDRNGFPRDSGAVTIRHIMNDEHF